MTNEEIFGRQAGTNLLAFEEEVALWKEEMKVLEEKLSRCRGAFLKELEAARRRLQDAC